MAYATKDENTEFARRKFAWAAKFVFGLLVLVIAFFSTVYQVGEYERGVITRFGAYHETSAPGAHFKLPFVDGVTSFDTSNRTVKWVDNGGEGSNPPLEAYSFDTQLAHIQVSIGYHIPESGVETAYKKYKTVEGLEQNLLLRNIPQDVKVVFGQFTAQSITQTQGKFISQLEVEVRKRLDGTPVVIDFVNVEDVAFSKVYEESVERRMLAEVKVAENKQEFEQEKVKKDITVMKAEAVASSQIKAAEAAAQATKLQADADAERITKLGNAQASAIKARVEALGSNPDAIIRLTNAEKWNGSLPSTMLPNSTVPFLDLSQNVSK